MRVAKWLGVGGRALRSVTAVPLVVVVLGVECRARSLRVATHVRLKVIFCFLRASNYVCSTERLQGSH